MRLKANCLSIDSKNTQQYYGPPDEIEEINQQNNDIEIHKFVFT